MKKITLLLMLFMSTCFMHAQVSSYSFSTGTTGTLDPMTASTQLLGSGSDDGVSSLQSIGFTFNFAGTDYTQFSANANGVIRLGATLATSQWNNSPANAALTTPAIFTYWDDLATGTNGKVHYVLTGTAPNQKLIVEWFVTIPRNTGGVAAAKFQCVLEETTNKITFVYGTGMVANTGYAGSTVGIATSGSLFNTVNIVTNTNSASTFIIDNLAPITEGRTYTFTPPTCPGSTGLVATNITAFTATVTWTEPASVPANGYEYVVSSSAIPPTGAGTPSATNSADVTSLDPSTVYYVYVRSICGSDFGTWVSLGSFKTLCTEVTDFVQTFDSFTTTGLGVLPDCWSKLGTSIGVYVTGGATAPMSPSNRLYMNVGSTTTVFAVLPPVSNLQAATHRLRFKAYAPDLNKTLNIGYFTDPTNLSTFVQLQSFVVPGTLATTAQEFTFVPIALPVGINQLVLTTPAASNTTIYIDDVKWEINSPCVEPSQLTTNIITNNSAQLAWVAGGATAWEIQYGPVNFALGTGTIIPSVIDNPYSLSGLTANTNYQYYVRGVCEGSVNSSWAGPFTFRTQCDDVTEYTENFDALTNLNLTSMPDCWRRGLVGSPSIYVTTGSVAPMSPNNRLYMFASGTATPPSESYAILPPVSNLQAGTHRLRFKGFASIANRPLQVGYLTNPSDLNSFVQLEEIILPGTTVDATLEFTIVPGTLPVGVKHLAIRNPGFPSSSTTVYLDDFKWEAIPTCIEPSVLTATGITNSSAILGWDEANTATAWEIEYGAPGFTIGTGEIVAAPSNPFELTGLTANTNYVYYVRAVCSPTDSSYWVGPLAFKTKCDDVTEFVQNFDSPNQSTAYNGPLPDCWIKGLVGAPTLYVTTGSVLPMSPTKRMVMTVSSTATPAQMAYAILPAISNLNAGTHRLRFKAFATAVDRFLEVGYLTNPSDLSTFVPLTDFQVPGTAIANTQQFIYAPLSVAIPLGVKHLAILNPGFPGGSSTIYIDDVSWESIPTCPEPSALTATDITNSSAMLGWVEANTATAWEIQYGTPGFTVGTGEIVAAPTNPFELTGLTANTNYEYYVRAVCSPTDSSYWVGPLAFKTQCDDLTEFVQNFDSPDQSTAYNGPLPDCWSKGLVGVPTFYVTTGSVLPMSPTKRMIMTVTSTTTPAQMAYAILPAVSNLNAGTHRLRFKAFATAADRFLELGYLTDPADLSTFVSLTDFQVPGTAVASTQQFMYAPLAGAIPLGVKYLAILNPGFPGGSSTIYIDDVIWEAVPSCLEPTNVSVSGVLDTTATLNWTAASPAPAAGYEYYVSTTNTNPDGTTVPTGSVGAGITTAALTDLTAVTTYYVWVRSVCSVSDKSAWTLSVSFVTPCASFVPEYTQNFATFIPACWNKYNGGSIATGPTGTPNTGNWFADGFLNNGTTGAAKVELYGFNNRYWLVSPVFDMSAGNYQVKFDYGVTNWNTSAANAMGSDDEVHFLVSQDAGTTWQILTTFNAASNVSNAQNAFVLPITTYVSPSTKFAFLASDGTFDDPLDYNFYVDNFVVQIVPTVVPSCSTNVTAVPNATCGNNPTAISWDAVIGADSYKLTIGTTTGGSEILNGLVVGGLNYSFVGNLNTTYYYKVVPFNTVGDATSCVEQSFITAPNGCLCVALPTSNDGTGITNVEVGTTDFPNGDVFYFNHSANVVNLQQGVNANLQVSYNTLTFAYYTYVWVDYNDNFNFEPSELVYTGQASATNPSTLDASFLIPMSAPLGQHRMRIGGVWTAQTSPNPCYTGTYGVYLDFMINVVSDLSTDAFDSASFSYYPNPVTDQLSLSYSNTISEVIVYNLLGQQVLTAKPNATQTQVDLSGLNTGTYMVKVTSNEVTKTIKVVKN